MRCQNCGAELEEGVKFCRECGSKVFENRKRFCRECGTELPDGVKFCPECGANIALMNEQLAQAESHEESEESWHTVEVEKEATTLPKIPMGFPSGSHRTDSKNSFNKGINLKPDRAETKKNKKPIAIIIGVIVLLLLLSSLGRNGKKSDSASKAENSSNTVTSETAEQPKAVTNYTIEKGTEYAFMSDEWNVYIASAVSDSIIKIEHWDKTLQSSKKLKFSEDIGTFKINDTENGFSWIDEEQTAFSVIFQDKNNSRVKKAAPHIFTININDDAKFRGTDYDEKIACYSYTCDDWHMYRAIPLTENLIKIECWARTSSLDSFCFGWDWCVVDPNNNDKEFEWTDDEHTSFTMTTQDLQNKSYWKEPTFVLFESENENFKYATVKDYLDGVKVGSKDKEEPETKEEEKKEEPTTEEESEEVKEPETQAPIETEAPEETEAKEESVQEEQKEDVQSSVITMPVMKGSSLESAVKVAEGYGLSQPFDDDDFGYGTKYRTMSTDDGGLMLNIVYSTETKEILMGSITTLPLASADDQKSFIKSMSKVLCPEASSGDVESWVSSNIGSATETTIDGVVYQLEFGPTDNALYFAGQQNWEEWDLTHY